jgi:hypothetical protein
MIKHHIIIPSTITAVGIILFFAATAEIQFAFAHQRQLFMIGDKDYLFVVGSINEPLYVDDKSGVEFFCLLA